MKSGNISNPEENNNDKKIGLQAETDNIKQYLVSLLINWKWIVLSLIVCLGIGMAFVRYNNTVYSISEKVLIKTGDNNNSGSSLKSQTMGFMATSDGFDNELEILSTHTLAKQTVRDLNLFVSYYSVGTFKNTLLYKDQPVNVSVGIGEAEKLTGAFKVEIEHENGKYNITAPNVDVTVKSLPTTIEARGCRLRPSSSRQTKPPTISKDASTP